MTFHQYVANQKLSGQKFTFRHDGRPLVIHAASALEAERAAQSLFNQFESDSRHGRI
jgi:hypothetical protein